MIPGLGGFVMQKRLLFLLHAVLAAVLSGSLSSCSAPPLVFERPPVLIFDIDTLRADHLGCYGYSRPTSPNIDAFAAQAVRFEWVFSQGPNTPPSQASILTGQYPTTHGRIVNNQKIRETAPRLAAELAEAGYLTEAYVDGGLMVKGFGYEQGFDVYDDEAGHLAAIGPKVFDRLKAVAEQARSGSSSPWFLLVHTYDVHSPYEISPEPFNTFFTSQLDRLPSEDFQGRMSEVMADVWKSRGSGSAGHLTPVQLEYAKACYDGGIRHVDDWFGKLLKRLEKEGLFDQCLIVVISDHGDEFQEHGGLFHERIYAPVARIPMLIRLPYGQHGGTVVNNVVQSIDLLPTILERLGLDVPPGVQGRSLLPLIRGEQVGERAAFTESPYFGRRIAVATEKHRLIHTGETDSSELFLYRDDPLELRALNEPQGALETGLRRRIDSWRVFVAVDEPASEEGPGWSAEQLEQLRVLGYVD